MRGETKVCKKKKKINLKIDYTVSGPMRATDAVHPSKFAGFVKEKI